MPRTATRQATMSARLHPGASPCSCASSRRGSYDARRVAATRENVPIAISMSPSVAGAHVGRPGQQRPLALFRQVLEELDDREAEADHGQRGVRTHAIRVRSVARKVRRKARRVRSSARLVHVENLRARCHRADEDEDAVGLTGCRGHPPALFVDHRTPHALVLHPLEHQLAIRPAGRSRWARCAHRRAS